MFCSTLELSNSHSWEPITLQSQASAHLALIYKNHATEGLQVCQSLFSVKFILFFAISISEKGKNDQTYWIQIWCLQISLKLDFWTCDSV